MVVTDPFSVHATDRSLSTYTKHSYDDILAAQRVHREGSSLPFLASSSSATPKDKLTPHVNLGSDGTSTGNNTPHTRTLPTSTRTPIQPTSEQGGSGPVFTSGRTSHLDAGTSMGLPPLHYSCYQRDYQKVWDLVVAGEDVNVVDGTEYKAYPLHWVAMSGDVAITKLLIRSGANVAMENRRGQSPLHVAAFRGHKELVKILLEAKSDPCKIEMARGRCAAELAIMGGSQDWREIAIMCSENITKSLTDTVKRAITLAVDNAPHQVVLNALTDQGPLQHQQPPSTTSGTPHASPRYHRLVATMAELTTPLRSQPNSTAPSIASSIAPSTPPMWTSRSSSTVSTPPPQHHHPQSQSRNWNPSHLHSVATATSVAAHLEVPHHPCAPKTVHTLGLEGAHVPEDTAMRPPSSVIPSLLPSSAGSFEALAPFTLQFARERGFSCGSTGSHDSTSDRLTATKGDNTPISSVATSTYSTSARASPLGVGTASDTSHQSLLGYSPFGVSHNTTRPLTIAESSSKHPSYNTNSRPIGSPSCVTARLTSERDTRRMEEGGWPATSQVASAAETKTQHHSSAVSLARDISRSLSQSVNNTSKVFSPLPSPIISDGPKPKITTGETIHIREGSGCHSSASLKVASSTVATAQTRENLHSMGTVTPTSTSNIMGRSSNAQHSTDTSSVAVNDNKPGSICVVCRENEIDVVILKCGHLAACGNCCDSMFRCPICRDKITDVLKIYRV